MINKSTTNNSSPPPSHELWAGTDHLDSWKEIASYLRREIRTVQLWEKREGLPIHRHFHQQLGSVYALRSELERWKGRVSRKSASQVITARRRGLKTIAMSSPTPSSNIPAG